MAAGPGFVGIAQSHAILGIGPDLLDLFGGDDDKSDLHHPRPGSENSSSGQAARTVGVTTADAGPPVSTFGSGPESVGLVAGGGDVPRSAGGGGGSGAVPRVRPAGRSIEPAVCALRTDYPQHRHPRDTVDGSPGGHACACLRAACIASNARHCRVGCAAPGCTGTRGQACACRATGALTIGATGERPTGA